MTIKSDSEPAEAGDPHASPEDLDGSLVVNREKSPAQIMTRLDGALATAERKVLSPFRKVAEGLRDLRGDARREPLYVSYLRLPRAGPVTALVALMLLYIGVFGTLTYQQQSNYGTYGFDMGIYDQGLWLVSHFKNPFVTIRGLDYFGHHVNIITLLFVPAYWLGAGPHFLYAVETVWLAAGAIPIWLLGRDRLESAWMPLGLSAAYLLYAPLEWINQWQFHPDALIITPLMFAYWLATRQRWGWFWVAVGLALSCKEDAGLAVFALGFCLWLKHRQRAYGLDYGHSRSSMVSDLHKAHHSFGQRRAQHRSTSPTSRNSAHRSSRSSATFSFIPADGSKRRLLVRGGRTTPRCSGRWRCWPYSSRWCC